MYAPPPAPFVGKALHMQHMQHAPDVPPVDEVVAVAGVAFVLAVAAYAALALLRGWFERRDRRQEALRAGHGLPREDLGTDGLRALCDFTGPVLPARFDTEGGLVAGAGFVPGEEAVHARPDPRVGVVLRRVWR